MPNMDFYVWPFRFHFAAVGPVVFPEGKASNILRGAFGTIFRQLACVPECRETRTCGMADRVDAVIPTASERITVAASTPSSQISSPTNFRESALA